MSESRRPRLVTAVAALSLGFVLVPAHRASAQYAIDWHTVDGGGAMGTTGGTYDLSGTAGQPDASGNLTGGTYGLVGGFWGIVILGGPVADLVMSKTDGVVSLVPGLPVTYVMLASNASPTQTVVGATVSDPLAAALLGATWTCSASPGSTCTASGSGSISDSVTLAPSGAATYTLNATVDPAARGTLDNIVTIAVPPGGSDPNPSNNQATDTDTLTPEADLTVAIADAPDPVGQGGTLHYTLTVGNTGPSSALAPTLTDLLPSGVFLLSSPAGCTPSGGSVTCNLAALSPSGTATVALDVAVGMGALGTITDTANVTAAEPDPNPADNGDTEDTLVVRPRDGELVHGSQIVADLRANGPVSDEDWYRISQKPHASYEAVVDGTSGDLGSGSGPFLERLASDGSVLQTAVAAGAGASRSLRWENNGAAPVESEYVRVRSASCTTDCTAEDVYRLRVAETTASIPRFNNSATQITVMVLQNTTDQTVSGHADFWAASGTLLGSSAFSLASHQALVLNTAGVPGVSGQSGTVSVTHDGPHGALQGKAVSVEPATGFTFDTLMVPRQR